MSEYISRSPEDKIGYLGDILKKIRPNVQVKLGQDMDSLVSVERRGGRGYVVTLDKDRLVEFEEERCLIQMLTAIDALESKAKMRGNDALKKELETYDQYRGNPAYKLFYGVLDQLIAMKRKNVAPIYYGGLLKGLNRQLDVLSRKYQPVPRHIQFLVGFAGADKNKIMDEEVLDSIEELEDAGISSLLMDPRRTDGEKLVAIHQYILPQYEYFLKLDKENWKPVKKKKAEEVRREVEEAMKEEDSKDVPSKKDESSDSSSKKEDDANGGVDQALEEEAPDAPQGIKTDEKENVQEGDGVEADGVGDASDSSNSEGQSEDENGQVGGGSQGGLNEKGQQSSPSSGGGSAETPDHRDEYETPEGGSFENDPSGNGYKLEIYPPLMGYYVIDHKSQFDATKKRWMNIAKRSEYLKATPFSGEVHSIEGILAGAGLKNLPIPQGYTLDFDSLSYTGLQPMLYRDENGAFFMKIQGQCQFKVDFYKEENAIVPSPTAEDKKLLSALGVNSLSPETQALIGQISSLKDPLEKARKIRDHVRKHHAYPPGKNNKETLNNAKKIQSKLNSASGDHLQNLDHSEHLECYSANTLMVGLMRVLGVPARMCTGHHVKSLNRQGNAEVNGGNGHGWCLIFDGSKWVRFDATPDQDPNDPENKKDKNEDGQEGGGNADEKSKSESADDGGEDTHSDSEDNSNSEGGDDSAEGEGESGESQGQEGQGGQSEGGEGEHQEGGDSSGGGESQEGAENSSSEEGGQEDSGGNPDSDEKSEDESGEGGQSGDQQQEDAEGNEGGEGEGAGEGGEEGGSSGGEEDGMAEGDEQGDFDPEEMFKKMYDELSKDQSEAPTQEAIDDAAKQMDLETKKEQIQMDPDERDLRNRFPELDAHRIKELARFVKSFRQELSRISSLPNPAFREGVSENATLEEELRSILDRVISRSIRERDVPRFPVADGNQLMLHNPVQLYVDSHRGQGESYSFIERTIGYEEELKIVKVRRRKVLDGSGSMGGQKLKIQQQIEVLENKITAEKQGELDELSDQLDRDLRLETETWQFGVIDSQTGRDFSRLKALSSSFSELEQAAVWTLSGRASGGTNDYDPLESIQALLMEENRVSVEQADGPSLLHKIRLGFLVRERNALRDLEAREAELTPLESEYLEHIAAVDSLNSFRWLLRFIPSKAAISQQERAFFNQYIDKANASEKFREWAQNFIEYKNLSDGEKEFFRNLDLSGKSLAEIYGEWQQVILEENDNNIEPILEIIEVTSDGGSNDRDRLQRVLNGLRGLGVVVIGYGLGTDGGPVLDVYGNEYNPSEGGYRCLNLLDYPAKKAAAWNNLLDKI